MYILAINCGSSSIKGKLYPIPSQPTQPLRDCASLSVSNIASHGERIKVKVNWTEGGKGLEEEGEDGGNVEYSSLVPMLLGKLTTSGSVNKADIHYVVHRIVHGGTHEKGLVITKDHTEGLDEMDKLSEFAPLHNHHAVLAVRSCLEALPDHTSFLAFDTLFHQTIPPETYTYALPPAHKPIQMPIRKYGFHGLSYASIVRSLAGHLRKREEEINIVVAHLGSGASACCIKGGKSIDTSMGLSPLEGLIGGTRSGTIDPTAIFHMFEDPGADGGLEGIQVTKAELVFNKQSGLLALAGTTNFGLLLSRLSNPSDPEHGQAALAYSIYLDRLMGYVSQYLFKLLSTLPLSSIDGIVFSGGIGERASPLRKDVLSRFSWLGAEVDEGKNESKEIEEGVKEITKQGSGLKGWVVETDEEGWCAQLAREEFGF
ncbi:acetate kinase [Tremella mesenterica]|uniref:Probable acetate kinase n=1 Tax=Tremella mesenterica TaxID=5217 RepID=A0A4Q1BIA8_TREME|nr:uncharacterized protein TREMEDRAFT_42503 [Tremella mesenterica DSM 1558]EIW70960.1 hypothetical protein TREMEDRAFT_42503 [Tremella mesenterica DSM 1558]RXK37326.1 acetate kinase [Tremella mesenterica]